MRDPPRQDQSRQRADAFLQDPRGSGWSADVAHSGHVAPHGVALAHEKLHELVVAGPVEMDECWIGGWLGYVRLRPQLIRVFNVFTILVVAAIVVLADGCCCCFVEA